MKKFKEFIEEGFGRTFRLLPFSSMKNTATGERILTKQDLEIVIPKNDWKRIMNVLNKGGSHKFKARNGETIKFDKIEVRGMDELLVIVGGFEAGLLQKSTIKHLL